MRQIDSPTPSASGRQTEQTTRAGHQCGVRTRRARVPATFAAALTLVATMLAVGPAAGLDGDRIGPLNEMGFPTYYTDDTGLALRLCIDGSASCLGTTRADLRDSADGEAFYWAAVAELPTSRGTLDVELALEAAWAAPGSPTVFNRLRIRGHLDRAGRYVLLHPYGQQVVRAENPSEQRNVNLTIDRPCSLVQGDCGQITDFLRSTSFPDGYIGMGEVATRVTGGSERNSVSLLSRRGRTLGTSHRFAVVGQVFGSSAGELAPTRADFGNTGRTRTRTLRIHNPGSRALSITGVRVRGTSRVTRRQGGCRAGSSVAAGSSCRVTLVYRPGRPREVTGTLLVTDSSPSARHAVPITAATAPEASAPDSARFRARRVGTQSRPRRIVVRNTGVRTLRISGVRVRGADRRGFQLVPGNDRCRHGVRVAPGGSCSVHVSFAPRAPRPWSARLRIRSDAIDGPTTVALSGRGRPRRR